MGQALGNTRSGGESQPLSLRFFSDVALRAMASEAAAFGITTVQVFPGTSIDRFVRLLDVREATDRVRAIALSLTTPQGRDLTRFVGSPSSTRRTPT